MSRCTVEAGVKVDKKIEQAVAPVEEKVRETISVVSSLLSMKASVAVSYIVYMDLLVNA